MAYTAGFSQGVTFTKDGGSLATLNIKSHKWREFVNALNSTHTGSGGIAAKIASYLDGDGSVEAWLDSASVPFATGQDIKAGNKGVITFALGTATPTSAHVLITEVGTSSSVDGNVGYTFNVGLDSTTGSYTRAS